MKRTIALLNLLLLGGLTTHAQFLPGRLAVLRAGDGVMNLSLKQAPIFVDQFDPDKKNASPTYSVAIPTKGASALFFNGHAATEGILTRSADRTQLSFAGYGGDLLAATGTPSQLTIPRGYCSVDAAGVVKTHLIAGPASEAKANPRGMVTDGSNNFWGCGSANGSLFCNPNTTPEPVRFMDLPNSRSLKIVNNILYAAINGADANAGDRQPGIYDFKDASDKPAGLPRTEDVKAVLVIKLASPYTKDAGFDINPAGTIAYVADTSAGVQKYVKNNGAWSLAYNLAIPQVIPTNLNNFAGCFALVADFSAATPVIYATTTEGYGNSVNSNRVVCIKDTGANSAVTTVAESGSVNTAFRGIEFTPAAKPAMTAGQ